MLLKADLHNHSCLSPCGSLEMSPRAMAFKAKELGIDALALTDHNSALNCPAFAAACKEAGILGIYGMEITSCEEIHILALFETPEEALHLDRFLTPHYKGFKNIPEKMGDQIYLDEDENILGEVEINLAQGASSLTMEDLGNEIHKRGGLFIPAHIDRPSFSLISQLGFIPQGSYDALETVNIPWTNPQGRTLISGSDSHYLDDMGKRSFQWESEETTYRGLILAIKSHKVHKIINGS
ncbi:MAG: PHP domain-containing protein [Spirochaetaceae bacterium]|jgi:PHP family Zn ribbon phosphoesterase|nr:PHP domain-containing protein [Spirochaetaceae bacterium]